MFLRTETNKIGPHIVEQCGEIVELYKNHKRIGYVQQWECVYCGHTAADRASFTWRNRDCNGIEWLESEKERHKERETDYE